MENSNGESKNQADLVDEINDDMDSFFDLVGTLGSGTVPFKVRCPDDLEQSYDGVLEKLKGHLNGDGEQLMRDLDSAVGDKMAHMETTSLMTGVVIGLRMAGKSKEEASELTKAWF